MRLKNLHVFPDNNFYNLFIDNLKEVKHFSTNEFAVVIRGSKLDYEPKHEGVMVFNNVKELVKFYDIDMFDHIIFHSMRTEYVRGILPFIGSNKEISWIVYGHEIYNRFSILGDFLLPKTKRFYYSINNTQLVRKLIASLYKRFSIQGYKDSNQMKKISRFCHWNTFEFDLAKKVFKLDGVSFIPFNFCFKSEVVTKSNKKEKSNYIVMGNSAALSGNHLDFVPLLNNEKFSHFDKCYIIFSYGKDNKYLKLVQSSIPNNICVDVEFVNDLLPINDYFNLIGSASLAIFNNLRAQGGHNVQFYLANQIPIVMQEKSVFYKFLSKNGIKIITMNEFLNGKTDLPQSVLLKNKLLRDKLFDKNAMNENYKRLLQI